MRAIAHLKVEDAARRVRPPGARRLRTSRLVLPHLANRGWAGTSSAQGRLRRHCVTSFAGPGPPDA